MQRVKKVRTASPRPAIRSEEHVTKEFFTNQYCRFEGPITQMVSLLPADKLDWSPADNTMASRALIQHLIDSSQGMASMLVSGEWIPRPADTDGGKGKTKEQFSTEVKAAFAQARTTLDGLTQEQFETARSKIEAGPVSMEGTAEELGVSLCLIHTAYHVMQLFWYLKQAGVDADSGTLYFGMPPGQFSTRATEMQATA